MGNDIDEILIENRLGGGAISGATAWLDEMYHDPDETEYLVELLRDELLKVWQQNAVLTECVKQHIVEQSALVERKDVAKA